MADEDMTIVEGLAEFVVPDMYRTIGFEKTIQTKQFHPIKFFSFVKDIPLEKWQDPEWITNLWQLIHIQTYRMVAIDHALRMELSTVDDPEEYLHALETEFVEKLDLSGINVHHAFYAEDEAILDERKSEE